MDDISLPSLCGGDAPLFLIRSHILGTGAYAPKKILTNQDLEQMVETTDAWI
jgi:hypothetical protein